MELIICSDWNDSSVKYQQLLSFFYKTHCWINRLSCIHNPFRKKTHKLYPDKPNKRNKKLNSNKMMILIEKNDIIIISSSSHHTLQFQYKPYTNKSEGKARNKLPACLLPKQQQEDIHTICSTFAAVSILVLCVVLCLCRLFHILAPTLFVYTTRNQAMESRKKSTSEITIYNRQKWVV